MGCGSERRGGGEARGKNSGLLPAPSVRLRRSVKRAKRCVRCGQGSLVFFEVSHEVSSLAAFVTQRGLGPFGISVEVADLKTAQRMVEGGTQTRLKIQRLGEELGSVFPEQLAAGMYVEWSPESGTNTLQGCSKRYQDLQ